MVRTSARHVYDLICQTTNDRGEHYLPCLICGRPADLSLEPKCTPGPVVVVGGSDTWNRVQTWTLRCQEHR